MTADKQDRKNVFVEIPVVDLRTVDLSRDLARILSEEIALKIGGIVIGKPVDAALVVAVKDPTQIYIYDTIGYATGDQYTVTLLKGDPALIDLAVEFVYRVSPLQAETPWGEWLEQKRYAGEKLDLRSPDREVAGVAREVTGTVIDMVNTIIVEAISMGASDIHLESFEDRLVVRYRLDGVLHMVNEITDMDEARALVKRLKIMADMDIAIERVTQGGRISVRVADKAFDLRVSIVPVPAGESVVLRLLSKGAFTLSLETLGFSRAELALYRQMVARPFGIILASGPTGSGKSTTLYASLNEINRPDRKLLTVEDPIEYQMPGIVQVQVNLAPREDEKRVTFAKVLREFLRHDPDVILVGEIRDEETAEIAVKAALTGHLVLSTIHTNDAVGIVNRLKDMQVKPYLIAATLIGGLAQRLVRRLCAECKAPAPFPEEFRPILDARGIRAPEFFRAAGCGKCRRTGYRGRVALYETLVVSDEIRETIETGGTAGEIFRLARAQGMTILLEDGVAKAAAGVTSPDEIRRVCMMDIAGGDGEAGQAAPPERART